MNMEQLSVVELGIAAALVLALAGVNLALGLGQARSLLVAAVRATVQLLLVGLVLKFVFDVGHWGWVALIGLFMLAMAGYEVLARQKRRFAGVWGYGVGAVSMFVSSFSVTLLALMVIVAPTPWYEPQYAIPLLGMILGNTMTGIAVAMERLTDAAWRQRREIEGRLLTGVTWAQAIAEPRRDAARAGLTPIINAMAASGVVSLPGMMTGQILAGAPPVEAVKYQIMILFLIAVGTGFGVLAALWLASRRLFDERQRLRLDRLKARA
ncbi:MAG: iron export ABC transporter permease subunit FetB [Gammaproteobacteria bacterium]|nr:iron export ABC transporter permease subunit FetB [Gammaproteobacteria bacterium]MDX5374936.1 iron export ABC transporter permease subunit FetB [Gammaproteobacteria bacterium]